jgi:SAM-dependent methyltransferase
VRSVKDLLSNVPLYLGLQRLVGADLLRYRCIEELSITPGDVVIDIGCGPAYYFDRLPQPITYHGFDTDEGYVAWATKRWGSRGTFHQGIFDDAAAASLPKPNAVMLLGLLHHLSDQESRALLALSSRILAPGGRVVSVDTCFEPNQGRLSRWMSENDRGEYVREPQGFADLANVEFGDVTGEVVSAQRRIPGAYWLMRMRSPRLKEPETPAPSAVPTSPAE